MADAADGVVLCECFARDGLQHEEAFIPTDTKVAAIDSFTALGFRRVEATSYSHPKYVPQFADADEVRPWSASWSFACLTNRHP